MKPRTVQWLGAALIVGMGIIHLLMAPVEFVEAAYLGVLFEANFLASIIATRGILRGKTWGWALGLLLAVGALAGYVLSRTVGMPGMEIEDWFYPVGVLSLVLEGAFVALVVVAKPWPDFARSLKKGRYFVAAAAMLFALIMTGLSFFPSSSRPQVSDTSYLSHLAQAQLISPGALEAEYGVQVSLVGLSMMDSIIDFRLNIVNAEKARKLLEDPTKMPMLVVERSNTELMASSHHGHRKPLKDGGTYLTFFPNTGNVIRPGVPVTVMFGNLRMEPILAQ